MICVVKYSGLHYVLVGFNAYAGQLYELVTQLPIGSLHLHFLMTGCTANCTLYDVMESYIAHSWSVWPSMMDLVLTLLHVYGLRVSFAWWAALQLGCTDYWHALLIRAQCYSSSR